MTNRTAYQIRPRLDARATQDLLQLQRATRAPHSAIVRALLRLGAELPPERVRQAVLEAMHPQLGR